jgi:hypothetical protein
MIIDGALEVTGFALELNRREMTFENMFPQFLDIFFQPIRPVSRFSLFMVLTESPEEGGHQWSEDGQNKLFE